MSRIEASCTTCASRPPDKESVMPPNLNVAVAPEIKKVQSAPAIPLIEPPVPNRNYCGPSGTSNVSSSEPGTPSEWSHTGEFFGLTLPYLSPIKQPSLDPPLYSTPQLSFPRQAPSPPYHPSDTGPFDQVSHVFLPSKKDVRKSMTPGQASLFDALWSLGRPEADSVVLGSYSSFLGHNPLGPRPEGTTLAGPSYDLRYDVDQAAGHQEKIGPEDSHDGPEYAARLWHPLSLDRRVESNSLPFILQSYSLWMRNFLFEPVRIIPVARDYILDEYYQGPEARWRMLMTSNALRAITRSTGYSLEDLEVLQFHMHQGFPKAAASFGTDRQADMIKALLAMSTTYEFIGISLKVFPLSMVVKSMEAVAPLFRRACPDPDDRQVNLPSLLSNINIALEYYPTLDIVLGAIISRPMNFRYDTAFPPGVHESIFNIENGPGLRWKSGIPDRLVITLARMNALLEDFGSAVDRSVIKELELEIEGFKTFAVASVDPNLAAARLVVQESWRQAAYIYLYMVGLSSSS
ncbi:unnamed protein product [Rhizoctonia solani]|uniref:Uncharacterized protein n=1 Tax=Rhizoctonia solani TaxID=456999 RepID=A0A8H3GWX5_9AGAM|nr:unnamed protein product [Rhizoctonia solani]